MSATILKRSGPRAQRSSNAVVLERSDRSSPFTFNLLPLSSRPGQRGFTYITALILVAVVGISLNVAGQCWSTKMKREKEKELLFYGDKIRQAIESYNTAKPDGKTPQYPGSLKDLLKDPRYPKVRRHLRKIYKDPMTSEGEWGYVLAPKGGIKGVFSKSKDTPLKTGLFPSPYEDFEKAETYADWKFVFVPEQKAAEPPPPDGEKMPEVEPEKTGEKT